MTSKQVRSVTQSKPTRKVVLHSDPKIVGNYEGSARSARRLRDAIRKRQNARNKVVADVKEP